VEALIFTWESQEGFLEEVAFELGLEVLRWVKEAGHL
jgi:hypothetical protein